MSVKKARNKLFRKLNHFFKKTNTLFTVIALIGCMIGIVSKHIDGYIWLSRIGFLISTLFAGLSIFYKAIQSLTMKVIGIELLVTIAVCGALVIGEYSEAGIVCFLFQLGNILELRTIEITRKEIKSLTNLIPTKALKWNDGIIEEIDVDEVEEDDILIVRTGDQIATDGIVLEGEGYVIEATITGESLPVYKKVNSNLYAGTILEDGDLKMRATRVGEDTTFAKIIALVEEAQDAKSPVDRFIDRFAKWYTPCVILFAIVTLFLKKIITGLWDLDTSITVLVLACPGALVIGSPIASVAGIGKAAKSGIILKGGDTLHTFAKTNTIILDKTGTLTYGNTKVVNAYKLDGLNQEDLKVLSALEKKSSHPLAKAILEFTGNYDLDLEVETLKGLGLKTTYQQFNYYVGNERGVELDQPTKQIVREIQNKGISVVVLTKDEKVILILEIADQIKEEAKNFVEEISKLGVNRIIMASGDNQVVAKNVASQIGIQEYYGELLPEDKLELLKQVKNENRIVTFVGDGINDSPSLAYANTAIAMGSGTDVAIETSDVILIRSNLNDLVEALHISKRTIQICYENIAIAIGTVIFLLIGLFMGFIHMSIGMLVHEGSILVVIFNAIRLLYEEK